MLRNVDRMVLFLFITEQKYSVFAKEYFRWTEKGLERSQINFKLLGCSLIISAARRMSHD